MYLPSISKIISTCNFNMKNIDEISLRFPLHWVQNSVSFLHLEHFSVWGGRHVASGNHVGQRSYQGSSPPLVGLTSIYAHPFPPLEMEEEMVLSKVTPSLLWVPSPADSRYFVQILPVLYIWPLPLYICLPFVLRSLPSLKRKLPYILRLLVPILHNEACLARYLYCSRQHVPSCSL